MSDMLYNLAVALTRPEGKQQLADLEALMQRIQSRREVEAIPGIALTPNEEKALEFIRGELKEGHFPGVRKIAQAVGFKSSRSGARLLQTLRSKGVL